MDLAVGWLVFCTIQRLDELVCLCLFPGALIHRRLHTLIIRSLHAPCSNVLPQNGKLRNYFCWSCMWFVGIPESDASCLMTMEGHYSDLPPVALAGGAQSVSRGGSWLNSALLIGVVPISEFFSYSSLLACPVPPKCLHFNPEAVLIFPILPSDCQLCLKLDFQQHFL